MQKPQNYYKKYMELKPDDHKVHYALEQIYCRLKRFKDAKKEFEKYNAHNPDRISAEEYIDLERKIMDSKWRTVLHALHIMRMIDKKDVGDGKE